jgi:hypothetical protein
MGVGEDRPLQARFDAAFSLTISGARPQKVCKKSLGPQKVCKKSSIISMLLAVITQMAENENSMRNILGFILLRLKEV